MKESSVCYCGLYCENCATKARVVPAAQTLYKEMQQAGFEEVVPFLPNGEAFWSVLKSMAEEGTCDSCKAGSGNPDCAIRLCAKEKGVEVCALCECYPCPHFDELLKGYPVLKQDNALLREEGMAAWGRMQDGRRAEGFTYTNTPE